MEYETINKRLLQKSTVSQSCLQDCLDFAERMKRKTLRVRSEGSIPPYVTEAESRKQHSDSPLCNSLNKETPEMKQLISGIKGLTNRVRSIAQTYRPLFEGEIYLTGREVCERLFLSPRTLQDYRDKNIIPYTQIAGKILYRLSDINRILSENYVNRNLHR